MAKRTLHKVDGRILCQKDAMSEKHLIQQASTLEQADLRNLDLRGLNSLYMNTNNLRFSSLEDSDLSNAQLDDCDFTGCILDNASLAGTELRGTGLRGAILYGKQIMSLEYHHGLDHFPNYSYRCYAAITVHGEIYICMGCKHMTLGQWQANWANNKREFHPGTLREEQRRNVYNYLVSWAKTEMRHLREDYESYPNGAFKIEEGV